MEIYTMTKQLSMPLTLACAPSASSPSWVERAPFAALAPITVPVLAAERAPAPRVHQVFVQAELGDVALGGGITSTTSTTGFKGSNVSIKRYTDGGSGVPPRGRPV